MSTAFAFLKKNISWDELDIHTLLHYYRYASLLITSTFYLLGPPFVPLYYKLVLITVLFLEALVFIRVYRENTSALVKKILVLIELFGLLIVLVFTGGLDSAFLWYAINPILLSTTLLPYYFCWGAASSFIATAFYLQNYITSHPEFEPFIWSERAYILLIFILVTLSAQLSNYLIKKLAMQKSIMEKQLEHIKSLYEAIEIFSHHNDPEEVASLFAFYSKMLTGAVKAIIWARELGTSSNISRIIYAVSGPKKILVEENWYPYVKKLFEDTSNDWRTDLKTFPTTGKANAGTLLTVRIKSKSNIFGALSVYFPQSNRFKREESEKTLVFLADLYAAALDKRYLESMSEKILLAEEKDRIARQIHDTVNQNIFGLIHGLSNINRQYDFPEPAKEQLTLLQKTARRCLQDIRHSIYDLQNTQNKKTPFVNELKDYLSELQEINNITVKLTTTDNFDQFDPVERNSLVRIIREASCNAIRHGGCKNILIKMEYIDREFCLSITDDGCGFNIDELKERGHNGLGLHNMNKMAVNIGGKLVINSSPEIGTEIKLTKNYADQAMPSFKEEVIG